MPSLTSPTVARWAALPIGVVCISTSAILIRMTEGPPLVTAANRLVLAALVLLAVAAVWQRDDLIAAVTRYRLPLIASGVMLGVHFALWTESLFLTSVASAVFLIDSHPAIVALTARRALGEHTARGVLVGIALTAVGGLVITGGDFPVGAEALLGDAMAFGGTLLFAGYLVVGRAVRPRLGLAAYAGTVYGVAAVVLVAAALLAGLSLVDHAAHDLPLWLLLVLLPTLGGHTVFNWALRFLPVSVVSVAMLGDPVGTTLLAWLVLREPPPTTAIVGGALILLGLYLALRSSAD